MIILTIFVLLLQQVRPGENFTPESGPPAGVRVLVEASAAESAAFGEPFALKLQIRVAPGLLVFLPDTLPAAVAIGSVGAGAWTLAAAPGDSTDVQATYPVMGYRSGMMELPRLPIATKPRPVDDGGPAVRKLAELSSAEGADLRQIPLGSRGIGVLAEQEAAAESGLLRPSPPGDVLGEGRSFWVIVAAGIASMAGLGGAGMLLPGWFARRGTALLHRLRGRSPRRDALRELDRVRSLGWHLNGRADDFYAASTDAVRRFAERLEPGWGPALTTCELYAQLEERLGREHVASLAPPFATAEHVKFGRYRPSPAEAEEDWSVLREWIRGGPER
jgi:hypothetical protein